jgi:hypothetical protein
LEGIEEEISLFPPQSPDPLVQMVYAQTEEGALKETYANGMILLFYIHKYIEQNI